LQDNLPQETVLLPGADREGAVEPEGGLVEGLLDLTVALTAGCFDGAILMPAPAARTGLEVFHSLSAQATTGRAEPPSLDTMVRMIATLGGFLNRKHDGFPGPTTLWIGLQSIPDFVLAPEAQRSVQESRG